MYLYVGGDQVVRVKDIVAILRVDVADAPATRDFLDLLRSRRRLVDVSGSAPKSWVVTADRVFLSSISPLTLQRRIESFQRLAQG